MFSGELDISTIEGVSDDTKKDIESDDVGQAEKDLNTIDSATNTDGGGETVDTSKLLNKSTTYKEDGLESTGFTKTQEDLDNYKGDDYIKLDGTETQQEIMKKAIDAGYA